MSIWAVSIFSKNAGSRRGYSQRFFSEDRRADLTIQLVSNLGSRAGFLRRLQRDAAGCEDILPWMILA
jgi:hypothetical protein